MSITRINEFQAKAGKIDDLHEFLLSILPTIQSSNGCESCQLLQNHDDTTRFIVLEVWASAEAHKASLKNVPPERFVKIKPLLAGSPSGAYYSSV